MNKDDYNACDRVYTKCTLCPAKTNPYTVFDNIAKLQLNQMILNISVISTKLSLENLNFQRIVYLRSARTLNLT